MSCIFQTVLQDDFQVSDCLDKGPHPMLQYLFRDEMTKVACSIQVGCWFPECTIRTLSVWIVRVPMDSTVWLWFSKTSIFSKGFWFHPVYMGNRDEETSEDLRIQRHKTDWKPQHGVRKMPTPPQSTDRSADANVKLFKQKWEEKKNPCALPPSLCDLMNRDDTR